MATDPTPSKDDGSAYQDAFARIEAREQQLDAEMAEDLARIRAWGDAGEAEADRRIAAREAELQRLREEAFARQQELWDEIDRST